MGKVNKRIFNPRELNKGKRPVLIHTGRSSGAAYYTPLDAHAVDRGYIFIVMYGSHCDWVRNILAAGQATLRIDGDEIPLANPRLVETDQAARAFATNPNSTAKLRKKVEYLRMDVARVRNRNPET
jgi:deazaflavin-dependent oxidoreductase (nitroreductase family)